MARLLSLEQLSFLLWASTGITHQQGGYAFRAAPSAGALYPIETYVAVNHVQFLESGIYHYHIRSHELELLKKGMYGNSIAQAALGQPMCSQASVVFIWSAMFERCKWKYKQRAYRYVYLDVGHIAQNLALAATSIKLETCQIGALYDDEMNAFIDVDGQEESVLYLSAAGYPAK